MIIKLDNLGQFGIIRDALASQLSPNALSSGANVRTDNERIEKFLGHETFYYDDSDWDGGSTRQIYYLMPVASGTDYFWIYCGLNDVKVYDHTTTTSKEITNSGGDYTATASSVNWSGGIIGGIPVLNNGVDTPQMWDKDFATPGTLADLTGFSSSATSCMTMRVFKNYLIALDVTKAGGHYPSLVKWSDSAALGAVPTSWDETDETTDAGETDIAERKRNISTGVALDCLTLRDTNIIYMDDSVWAMDFIGGRFVFRFRELFSNWGMLTYKCMGDFKGNHFVVSQGDVYVHNGVTANSIINGKNRKYLFNDISATYYQKTFVYPNYQRNEMWICYVEQNSTGTIPNKAMVWNWETDSWGARDLPSDSTYGTAYIESGIVDVTDSTDVWTTGTASTWVDWDVPWGGLGYTPQKPSPAIATDRIYKGDSSNQFNGTNMLSYAERTDIRLGEEDEFCRVKCAYPRMVGGEVDIYVGSQQSPGGEVTYQDPQKFTPGIDKKVDVRVTGTHLAYKVQSATDVEWGISGIDFEYEPVYRR